MIHILYHRRAAKALTSLPRLFALSITNCVEELSRCSHPLEHRHVIKLKGRRTQDYRLRVGDYRVKFSLEKDNTAVITHVEHRQAGY